jgi:hypothetical protein
VDEMCTNKLVFFYPENSEKIRYKVPISLALVDKNHRSTQLDITLGWDEYDA